MVMLPTPWRKSPESVPILVNDMLTSYLELPQGYADAVFDSFVILVHHSVWLY